MVRGRSYGLNRGGGYYVPKQGVFAGAGFGTEFTGGKIVRNIPILVDAVEHVVEH